MDKRKEIAIIQGCKPNYNFEAFKFFILSLNKIQNQFEFYFPDTLGYPFDRKLYKKEDFYDFNDKKIEKIAHNPYYWIMILTEQIENNYFSCHLSKCAFISTFGWDKYISPPSLFEYLFDSILTSLIFKDTDFRLDFHNETRGSLFDYKRKKIDAKTSVSLGYIADNEREMIIKFVSKDYLNEIEFLLNKKWIGNKIEFGSVANILKQTYNYDVQKDSGFRKSFFKNSIDKLSEVPLEIFKIIIQTIFAIILAFLLLRLGLNQNSNEQKTKESPKQEQVNKP
jgi:hypothetical protein